MYQRYPKAAPRRMARRTRTIVWFAVIVLAVISVALLISFVRLYGQSGNTRVALIEKTQNEVSQARNRAYQLSSTSSTSSASQVALVRQHIYGVRLLNELCATIYGVGNTLVKDSTINLCVSYLDQLDHILATGGATTQSYTQLRDAVEALYEEADALR